MFTEHFFLASEFKGQALVRKAGEKPGNEAMRTHYKEYSTLRSCVEPTLEWTEI